MSHVRAATEEAFEEAVVASMLASGWSAGRPEFYHPESGLDTAHLFEFIGASQMDAWNTLVTYAGGDQDLAQREFSRLLAREIDERGALDVLRNGVKDRGVRIRLAYFRPAHTVAEDALVTAALANTATKVVIVTVQTRQDPSASASNSVRCRGSAWLSTYQSNRSETSRRTSARSRSSSGRRRCHGGG